MFFSGDQVYESPGGFGIIREPAGPAILNYLRKFYQFGWAFREVMRHSPPLCRPDDHDVFQGNIWGEGGAKMSNLAADPGASSSGGYAEPARMVNVVHRTNVAHHPDPYDPTPGKQGKSAAKGRAWASVLMLGSEAKGIAGILAPMKLSKPDQAMLSLFKSRLE